MGRWRERGREGGRGIEGWIVMESKGEGGEGGRGRERGEREVEGREE